MNKMLAASNAYLRDPAVRKKGLWLSAKTSSAVEGIRAPFSKALPSETRRPHKQIKITRPIVPIVHIVAKNGGSRRGK